MKDSMKDCSKKKKNSKFHDLFDFDAYFKKEVQQGKPIYDPKGSYGNLNIPKSQLSDYRKSQSRGFRA